MVQMVAESLAPACPNLPLLLRPPPLEARNGKQGLAFFQHANADLVITDIVMPEMDGFEVVTALREKHPSVKIIAISGADSGDYLDSARARGRSTGAGPVARQRASLAWFAPGLLRRSRLVR